MRPIFTAVTVLLFAASARAAELPQLFSHRASVEVPAEEQGVVRLELSADVLRYLKSDFSDLRLLANDSREVPFERLEPVPASPTSAVVSLPIRSADRKELPTKHREPASFVETYVLHLPENLPASASWTLELSTAQPEFVRRIQVEEKAGSVFRLRPMGVERLALELGELRPRAALQVRLEGQGGGFLSPEFRLVSTPVLEKQRVLELAPSVRSKPFAGETVLQLERPSGFQPSRIRLSARNSLFTREVTVFDVDPRGTSRRIGGGRVFRVPSSEGALEGLEVPVEPASGTHLEVRIADGDSGSLEALSLTLVGPQPTLVFASGDRRGESLRLYFGGRRTRAPQYDLAQLAQGDWRNTARAVYLAPVESNPIFRAEPPLRPFMHAGAQIDPRAFARRFTVQVPPSTEGLAEVVFTTAAAASLRPDSGDIRLVDSQQRQWPYLIEQRTQKLELALPAPTTDEGWSEFEIPLPAAPLWVGGLELRAGEQFFARHAELVAVDEEGRRNPIARTQLVNNPLAQSTESRLELAPSSPSRVHRLLLRIEDRQEAPLQNVRTQLSVVAPVLFTVAPEGQYEVLFGDPHAEPPEYDLSRARDLVLAVRAVDATEGRPEANAVYRKGLALARAPGAGKLAVWVAMLVAVLGLGALALRMARSDSKPS